MLKLATLLDNPGEPQAESRYRDPKHLAELGYNGRVIYSTTALSGVDRADSVGTGEMRRWVEQQFERHEQSIEESRAAGLDVYITYDVLSLPRQMVERDSDALTCKGRADVLCPASDVAIRRSADALRSLLDRWPTLSGVVLRFGDNDAARLPYLVGNELYQPHCARCSQLGRVDRVANVLDRFHKLVVDEYDKRLIARAWNVRPNGMHDSVDVCKRLYERLPGKEEDDRFVLSFKFTETDFWRYQRWNQASLQLGRRPVLYELQCQREFEGKGGIPNWQPPLWLQGGEETGDDRIGLADVSDQVNLAGLWAWVRGGGWGGPFTKNETWIDANVFAVPIIAENPKAKLETLAQEWIKQRLPDMSDKSAEAVESLLHHSTHFALEGFYIGPFAQLRDTPWHPNGDLIQDDVIDAEAAWRMIQRLPESELDNVVAEKQRAVDQVSQDMAVFLKLASNEKSSALEPVINVLAYSESLFAALRDLLGGLIAYRRWLKMPDDNRRVQARRLVLSAQTQWTHHTQRHSALSGAATSFRESHFWDLTQRIIEETESHR